MINLSIAPIGHLAQKPIATIKVDVKKLQIPSNFKEPNINRFNALDIIPVNESKTKAVRVVYHISKRSLDTSQCLRLVPEGLIIP